jgi:PD-(D/E)XK endonuclease
MKRDTKMIGTVSELKVMTALFDAGYRVAIPYGDSCRYDLIVEDRIGKLSRIQVKTGREVNGVVRFKCFSSHTHRGGVSTRRYTGQVECFGVYCPQNDRTYLIPSEDLAVEGFLRLTPTKNGQSKRIRWAGAYQLGNRKNSVAEVGHGAPCGVAVGALPL